MLSLGIFCPQLKQYMVSGTSFVSLILLDCILLVFLSLTTLGRKHLHIYINLYIFLVNLNRVLFSYKVSANKFESIRTRRGCENVIIL